MDITNRKYGHNMIQWDSLTWYIVFKFSYPFSKVDLLEMELEINQQLLSLPQESSKKKKSNEDWQNFIWKFRTMHWKNLTNACDKW